MIFILDKRDQLVVNLEKENFILNQDKIKNTHKSNEQAYYELEIKRLKNQLANEISDKELCKNKMYVISASNCLYYY